MTQAALCACVCVCVTIVGREVSCVAELRMFSDAALVLTSATVVVPALIRLARRLLEM